MSNSTKWFLAILGILATLALLVTLAIVSFLSDSGGGTETVRGGSGDKIAVVELAGVITSSDDVVRQIKRYRENSSIRGILLRIDSPGGAVVPSQEMYEEVRKTREGGKPVVVSMGSIAASGGYYVACGGSRLVANRGTLTGSIGVIAEFLQFHELLGKVGVDVETIKTGKRKDAGSATRAMTEDERRYLQGLLEDVHSQFLRVVEQERHLDPARLKDLADGRVFTGEQAVRLGLVDTIGTYEEAVEIAAELAGIDGEPTLIRERKHRSWWERMATDMGEQLKAVKDDLLVWPVLSFRFTGTQ